MLRRIYRAIIPLSLREKLKLGERLHVAALRLKIVLSLPLKKKRNKIKFGIHIAEHCNLNCKSCNNFSPLAEPEFVSIEEFERDFSRLGNIFNHECEHIDLTGGEALLHPEINTLIKIARKHFTVGNIFIYTNGILLSQKDSEFWKTCRDNKVDIFISAYPIKIDIETIRAQAGKFSVNVNWLWGQNENERNRFEISPVNLKGDSNIKLNFAMCYRANYCICLSHGKLFTCSCTPYLHHFSKYFSKDIRITEADYVNIYDDLSADEILSRLAQPIPACRYCDIVTPKKIIQWGISKREISVWV